MTEIEYPVTVNAKTLSALIMCGDAIIRTPRRERILHWARLKAIIQKQANETSDVEPPAHKPHGVDEHKHVRDRFKEFAAKRGIKVGWQRTVNKGKP